MASTGTVTPYGGVSRNRKSSRTKPTFYSGTTDNRIDDFNTRNLISPIGDTYTTRSISHDGYVPGVIPAMLPRVTANRPVIGASRGTNRGGVPTNTLNMGPSVNNPYSFLRGSSQVNASPIVPQTGYNNMQYNGPSGTSLYDTGTSPYTDTGVTKTQQYVFGGRTPATSKTPVVKRDTPTEQLSVDTSDVDTMDKGQLQSMIDMAYVKGGVLTEEEQIRLMKAQRRLQEMAIDEYKSSMINPYGQQIEQATQERERISDGLSSDQIKALSAQEKLLNEQQRNASIAEEDLIEQERKRIGDMYNARGMSNSSEATDALLNLETGLTNSLRMFNNIREAELEKYKQELMGANTERIAQYDTYIDSLTTKSQEFQANLANHINEYNMQSSMSYQDKLDSLFETSKSMQSQMAVDYDEEDQARAEMYAGVILDKNGDIDPKVLATVPQYLIPLVYQLASKNRGAKGDYSITKGETGVWKINKDTGQMEYVTEPGAGMDKESLINSYGSSLAVRNFNPGNIKDNTFGGQGNDEKGFRVFSSPQEGFDALVAKVKFNQNDPSSRYHGKTIAEYFQIYAPSSDNNNPTSYANQVAKALGVSVNTKISDVNAVKFAEQIAKHEDKNSYQMLQDMGIIGGEGDAYKLGSYLLEFLGLTKMSDADREYQIGLVKKAMKNEDMGILKQKVKNLLLEDKTAKDEFDNNITFIVGLNRAKELLAQYKQGGNQTGILQSIAEMTANALGMTTNETLAMAKNQLGKLLADYIRAISGTAASDKEVMRLQGILPNIKNVDNLNQAMFSQLTEQARQNIAGYLLNRYSFSEDIVRPVFPELFGEGIKSPTETGGGGRDETFYRN